MEKEKHFFQMVLPYLPRYWKVGALAVLCMALAAATNGAMISLIKPVLTQLFPGDTALFDLRENASLIDRWHLWIGQTLIAPFQERPLDVLLALAGVIVLATFLKGLFDFLGDYLSNYITQAFLRDFRNDLFGRLNRLSLDFYSETGTGSIMSRIVNDVEVLGRSLIIWGKLIAEPFTLSACRLSHSESTPS
jgi:ABC-type multidrug transport system fused ATPase/permease subunit